EAGDPGLLVPFLVLRGEGAYRGVVPRLAGVPGIAPIPFGPGGIVVYERTRTIDGAAGIAVDHDEPVYRLRVGCGPSRRYQAPPCVAHDGPVPKAAPSAGLFEEGNDPGQVVTGDVRGRRGTPAPRSINQVTAEQVRHQCRVGPR